MQSEIAFSKYHGAGNDFILIDFRKQNKKINENQRRKMCERKFGVGADGTLEIFDSTRAKFKVIYYNLDGRRGGLCGNGIRCALDYYFRKSSSKTSVKLEFNDRIIEGGIYQEELFYVKMCDVKIEDMVTYDENNFFVNTGTIHHVKFVSDIDAIDVSIAGKEFSYSQYGQDGCNINFCEILPNGNIKVRTYELGIEAETLACGTGATAAALITQFKKKTMAQSQNQATYNYGVLMPGGSLAVTFSKDEDLVTDIKLIGPATKVFTGKYFVPKDDANLYISK